MTIRIASPIFAGLVLFFSGPAAHAWHQEVTLQSQSTQTMVQFDSPGAASIPVSGAATSDAGKVTLLDLDLGHLWNQDAVAFRLADGRFLSAPGSGQVQASTLRLATDPVSSLQALAPEHRLRILVREVSGQCPGALFVPDPATSSLFPAPQPTELINDGCLVGFTNESGTRELFVNATGDLETRAIATGTSGGSDSVFRIRLRGLPPTQMLSSPLLEDNRFIPFVVHVDHRRHEGGQGVRCEDSNGRAPFEPNGRPCYAGHEGTDFIVRPISVGPGLTTPSIRAVAAAAGMVVGVADGNFDRCYFNPASNCVVTPPTRNSPPGLRCPTPGDYANYISCNRGPSGGPGRSANKVVILQDDGLVAEYVHLKNGSISVQIGERVECGQVLGLVGSSGTSSLPHLHFDLRKPPLPVNIDRPTREGDRSLMMPLTAGATQGSPELVDPYDYHDANGRATLWADLPGNRQNAFPRLVCRHPSQAQSDLLGGLPDGSPCVRNNQCRPTRICSSDGVCETPRQPGSACNAERDCATFSQCENRVCTRRGLAPGMQCGSGLICGPGLECVDGRCRLNAPPPPPPACPAGLSMKCPLPCAERDGACRRPSGGSCPRACLP